MANKPILCLDFDGVCHSYMSGWKGADVIPDEPVLGLQLFIEAAQQVFEVHIYSSRTGQTGGRKAMMDWFRDHFGLDFMLRLKFPTEKPAAFISIDDRCLLFTGQWPKIEELRDFKPWNKKVV